ncbi:ankyrin-2 isoform X9 [Anopheles arabiensis]|uniref:ankyrin-2 isoform X9 n=1 Tax=Anopheles arabiensis TaxID=7173 RepID=UPI001AAC89DC|nr:ankyrin-2 isoform X9 [Anopheles arabiensis]
MAQFVTHIQPTLIEASQGHVPHHHGHQVGVPHTSHLPHSGHNMPSPPTHHGHSHGHVHGHHHHGQGGSLVHSASRDMSNAKGSGGHKAPTHLPLSPKADDQHHHQPHYQHVEGYYQHAPMHYYQQQQHHHGHSHGHHHSGSDGNTSFLRAARAGNLEKVLEHLKNNIDINTCNANGLNALHLASKDGHVAVVTELLARGATVDAATKKGNTALHIASLAGQEDVVKLLIKHNASVNVQSQNGFTPLYMAAQENHDSVVRLLLSNGANQSLATEDGFTPLAVAMQQGHDKVVAVLLESDTRGKVRLPALHIAAKKDDVKAATLLLENDHNPDVTSKSGFTPLHIASHYGNEAMANLLIQKGADVNYAAKHNISPLHVAAKWGKTNMVALLLEKGASIESKTRDGLTPLHCAARSGHEQVVDMLLERGAPISSKTKNGLAPLHMAAQGEHVDAARILLYHRAPVDEVTVDYLTALHVAAHCGHVRVAKLLLDRNADANARALNGFTPLHIACKKNRIKVVELLLKHGASISATTESGLTPLHVASFMGCMNIVIYLLQHDASPDVPTVRGETPLHLAARANQTDIIRILLRNGAQVDARAREQQTPLHIASRLGNVDIVMLLLQHGAQVDAVTKDMYTALHIAAKEGQDEVAAVLLNNGAQIDATTKKGFTPLHLTAKYGHMKVAELLLEKSAPVDAQGKNGVTPLHVASHYDHQNVAMLLLEKGASPHATAKNGHTPLHIAARKNQIDIANTLLKYEAQANAESKAGFTPLHLSAQEGHTEMSGLLLESKANPDHQARNGLTPMHLCAQEDRVSVAQVLVKHGANLQAATKAGYTPLHVASHFGQANMVRYLIEQQVDVNASTGIGYTPLHQASQQGHCHIVNILLESNADPNAITNNGQTSLKIAQKLGYISVLDSLKSVTDAKATPDQPPSEEKYRVVAPEAMHETFMSDSEEEGGEDTVLSDQPYRYLTVDEMKSLGDDSLPIDVTRDERMDSNKMVQSTDSHQFPPTALEDSISPQHASMVQSGISATDFTDNINIERHSHVGKLHWKNFLVSFLVDARGGAMRGCRHSGVRIIVPARSAAQPTRITCRYVKPQRTMHPPPLMEGEALASRVLELGPVGAKFLGPVIMEVPHFASLRGKEREIVILRSDNGETWREHNIDMSDEIIHDVLNECFEPEELAQLDELGGGRICRFVTYDFPQYFAVISRIRQEVHAIGPEGGMVSSTVVPQVQAVFPQGALTKKIKVGLQAQPIDPDLTAKLLGRGVAVSPVVTVEPRRRKFHKAITLSMPAPRAHSQGMINQYSGSAPTLRLLCSITGVFRKRSLKGGTTRAQWEDVTGSTPLTFVNDCVSFTTTVSARFWLMDCRNIADATKMATELYKEAIHVPFMAKFVVFAKRTDPLEARLRVFCMTDDREDKTLEHQEHFTEVAKSRDVEVLEDKPQYIELAGNLVPVTKSGEQLALPFKAFRENRLPFAVRVKDQHADIVGRTLFMREPKIAKGEPPQQPICILNIVLPETIIPEQTTTITDSHEIMLRVGRVRAVVPPRQLVDDQNYLGELRIVDISNLLGEDWIRLAPEIGVSETDVENIVAQIPASTAQQAQAMLKQFQSKPNNDFNILENGLRTIHRDDIVERCIRSATTTGTTTTVTMRNKTSFSIGKRSVEAVELLSETDSIAKMAQKEDRLSKQESTKYSAEEKTVEESEESEEEMVKKTVAERRKQIEKRLSADRSIPASTQKREIVEEIITIKRQSVIDDTRAKHEEEILLQKPIDNTYKSSTMPEPVVKLKTTVVKDGPGVRKDEFEQELQDKFKVTLKNVEEFEHRSEVLEQLATEATSVSASSPRVVEEIKKKVEERVPAALDEPTEPAEQQPVESAVPPVPKERAPVPAKRTSLTKEPEEFQGVVEESIKDVKQRISSFETKSKTESLVDSKQSSVDTTSGRDSWSDDHRQASKRTDSEQISEDSEQEPLLRRDEHFSVQRTVGESSVVTTTQQAFTTVEQLERHDVSHAVEEKRESLLEAFGATDAGPAQWKEPDSEPSSLSEATGSSTSRREESISQHFKSETVSKVEETVTKMSTTVETKTVAGLPEGLDAFTLGKGDETIVREEFVARSAESSSIVDRTVESVVREVRDQEPAVEKRDMHREVKETADKMAALSSVETVQIGEGTAPQVSTAAAYTVERFEGLQSEVVSQDAAGMVAERTGTAVSSVETGVSQGEDTVSEKIVEREEEVRRRVEENVSIDKPVVQETVARTVTQEVTSKIPVPSKKSSPEAKDQPPMPAAQPTDGEPSAVDRMEAADQPKQTIEQQQAELSSRAEEMIETVVEHAESVASRIPRFGTTKPAAPQPEAVVAAKSPGPDTSSLSKIPVLKDRKVSEQFSSDSCETVIVQRSVEELQPHAEQVTASETVPDREYDEEIMSATAYGSERTVTEIITEDHRAVTPDDFIDEIIDEAQDKVQRQLQSAEVTVGTLDLSHSEEESFDKSAYPMQEYISRPGGGSGFDANATIEDDDEDEEAEREREKWKETDLQLQTENNIPQTTTPRLVSQTLEAAAPPASAVSDAFVSGQCVAIAATSASIVTTTAANLLTDANDVATADQCFAASATSVERTEQSVLSTTTSTIGSISNAEQSFSIASTEPDRPSESSSSGGGGGFDGQPVPKPRTSISSRTDTATRSSLLESFEHQDSIEQYPEPAPVQSAEQDLRLRQGSITSDELSNVAQKDSSELVTSEEDISSGAKFFIGECSSDIITRSSTEKRSDFAFDNEGYTFSQESQGTDDQESRRDAMEAYQQQIKLEDGFTLDSLKELDIAGLQSSGKPPVVHSPVTAPATVQPFAETQSVKSQVHVGEATILESTTTEQQEQQQQQYAHMTIDELTIAKTLEEVKESLDAVQEELIEAVTDGTPIKQSPSEFEFKILPSTRYVQDPIYETNQEEAVAVSTATGAAITTTTIVSESGLSDSETRSVAAAATAPPIKIDEAPTAAGSSDSSQLEASPRLRHGPAAAKGNRWSATDVDSSGESHYQSFEHTDSSRPLSSDLEQVLPYASSEYETALDHSMVPTSLGTEYHSAVSTLHSYAVSSHDSMKSFDSESSGNLASIESEATETLVPSTMDVDFDSSDAALIHDDSEDDLRDKLLLLDDKEEPSSAASSSVPIAMKRSHEMDFAELKGETVADESLLQFGEQRSHGVESVSSSFQEEKLLSSSIGTARDLVEAMQATSLEDVKTEPADDGKLGTSLEDGSILSISLSSASNLETIMENLSDKTTSIGPVPTHVEIGLDAVTPTTAGTTAGYIGDITLTSTTLKEGDVNFLNTQATTEMIEVSESAELIAGREDSEETVRKRGHKRTESTAIISGKFMAEMGENRDSIESQDESLSQDAPKPPATSSERDETRDESSDSDYDRYESEYARSFRAPVAQPKKKDKKAGDVFEKDFELDRRNSFSPSQSVIETIVEDVHAEIEQGDEAQQIMVSKSQRLQEYRESSTHNIPDIHVTEDFAEQQQQQSSDGEEEAKREATVFSETVSVVETVTKTQADATVSSSATTVRKVATETASTSAGMTMAKQTGIQYAKQEEFQLTEEQYQELIEQKYKAKLADSTTKYAFDADDKDDSAGSDSFEMLEQPDISDEFVIVEEVAREAHEFDAEGKSVAIKPTKIEKKHDEDVEKILVKSAPAHTNAGSLYAANMRDDMMYEFEESPPTGGAEGVDGGAGVTMDLLNNGYPLEESKRWVEMQLAETQNFRYPYEDRLEDIKEEDTDFEVGSSRIGSIKDSFSSTPDYDLLAKRMASREHDDISMSSLQEFENLEHVISLENRKMQQGSQDSLSNGSFTRRFMQRGMHGDDISLSSLKEFEGLENACLEAHLIEIKAKEEAALLLSRSDESNKSNGSNGAKRSPPSNGAAAVGSRQQSTEGAAATKIISSSTSITTTVVGGAVGSSVPSGEMTKVERKITTSSGSSREGSSTTTVTTITHVEGQTRQGLDEEDSTSHHILTVSSDSLDGTRVKQPLASGRDALPSAHSSSDSLDMHSKNNVDPMTSSIDSIEFSKTGIATTRSSQSDSIEQMAQQQQQPNRSDSTDSIEAQQQLQQQQKLQHHQTYHQTTTQQTLSDTKRDSLESLAASSSDNQSGFSSPTKSAHGSRPLSDSGVGASGTTAHQQQQQFHHQTTTMSTHTVSTGGRTMQKDISADSLTGPDAAFLTSTESLETSSTATNATYQNETDSQMSSSVTSCDSITMVDTVGPSQSLEHWDSSFTAGVHGGGFGASSLMTSSSMSAYSSGVVGSSGGTTIQQQQQQQQHAFRTSHAEASSSIRMSSSSTSSSSTVTMVASSASSTSVRTAQQQLMGESELLSRELFPGEIAFDDVKETSKERMQSKSTEKEE